MCNKQFPPFTEFYLKKEICTVGNAVQDRPFKDFFVNLGGSKLTCGGHKEIPGQLYVDTVTSDCCLQGTLPNPCL